MLSTVNIYKSTIVSLVLMKQFETRTLQKLVEDYLGDSLYYVMPNPAGKSAVNVYGHIYGKDIPGAPKELIEMFRGEYELAQIYQIDDTLYVTPSTRVITKPFEKVAERFEQDFGDAGLKVEYIGSVSLADESGFVDLE